MSYDPSRVKSLFLAASDLATPAERAAYLDRECGDPELRARVEALLAAQDRDGPAPMGDPGPGPGEIATLPDAAAETLGRSIAPEGPGPGVTLAATGDGGPDETVATRDGGPGGTAATRDGVTAITIAGFGAGATPAGFAPGGVVAGRYTLLGVLGQGGMGTVYLADQARPVRRQVALKLIRSGMDSRSVLARFDAERQALAMMDHPNIARVYDAGATESGHPFFVMELVRGEPITAFCDRHRFPVDGRLRLFVEVCRAVQHAHQKGIIHRDLKPTNVLVAEVDGRPTPKVIDFGVAKATEASLTDLSLGDTGAIVGTPAYMSPEQADPSSMDIDTRTDVYALGVILYELLAGTPPIDPSQFRRGALLEMLRMLREVDPAKPSTRVSTSDGLPSIAANRAVEPGRLKRELRGDLDWIAMKALEKDRTRRYETASGLASDILRHLASEPVLAAPPSRSYRARKFVAKHRVGVAAAALVLLALVGGVAGTTWGLVLARNAAEAERLAKLDAQEKERKAVAAAWAEGQARSEAQEKTMFFEAANQDRGLADIDESQAREMVDDVLGFVGTKVFAAARPEGQKGGLGRDVELPDAIKAALTAIEGGFPGKPLTEARLRQTIGRSFVDLGKPDLAVAQYEAAVELCRRSRGTGHFGTIQHTYEWLADSYASLGRRDEAIKLRAELMSFAKVRYGPDHPVTLHGRDKLADSYQALGRRDEAIKIREAWLPLAKAGYGPDHPATLHGMYKLADSYQALGRQGEALKLFEETLALRRAKLGPKHPDTLTTMNGLANSYAAVGRQGEALKLFEDTLATRRTRLSPDDPDTIATMNGLANSYAAVGRTDEAMKLSEELLPLARWTLGPDHPDTITTMNRLVEGYSAGGREREGLALLAERSSASPGDTIFSMKLAALQAWYGRSVEFAETRRRVFANANGTQDAGTAERAAKVGSLLPSADGEDLDAAIAMGRRAVELGKDNSFLDFYLMSLGMAEYRKGQFPEALATLDQSRASRKDHPGDGGRLNHAVDGTTAFFRAMCLFRLGKAGEARGLASEAAAKVKQLPTAGKYPLVDGADHDDLILWLAYREAKALIGFDPPPPPRRSPETNNGNRAGRRHPRAPGTPPPDIVRATSPGPLDTAQDVRDLGAGAAPAPGAGRLTRTSRASGLPAPREIRSRVAPGPLPRETARWYSPGDRSSAVNLPFVSSTGRDGDSPESRSIITVAPATGLPSSYETG